MLAAIDDLKLDSSTSHPSSSSHSLPCRVVCHPGHPAPTIMGGLVLRLKCAASFTRIDYRGLQSVQCRALRYTVRV